MKELEKWLDGLVAQGFDSVSIYAVYNQMRSIRISRLAKKES